MFVDGAGRNMLMAYIKKYDGRASPLSQETLCKLNQDKVRVGRGLAEGEGGGAGAGAGAGEGEGEGAGAGVRVRVS